MEALGDGAHVGEDALYVDAEGFDNAGQQNVLLLQEVAGHLYVVTHHHLVAGAAQADDVDALGTDGTGLLDHLGILGVTNDHLGHGGVMAVNDDVDHFLVQDAQVGLGLVRHGGAVEDVGHLGAGHGAAPAVGQTDAQRLTDQVLGIGGVAHVGHVHGGDDLAVLCMTPSRQLIQEWNLRSKTDSKSDCMFLPPTRAM